MSRIGKLIEAKSVVVFYPGWGKGRMNYDGKLMCTGLLLIL